MDALRIHDSMLGRVTPRCVQTVDEGSGGIDDRAAASLEAGCDVVLHCNGDIGEMRSVAEVAGEMGIQAQTRAERALERRRPPQQVDIAALKAELEALTGR